MKKLFVIFALIFGSISISYSQPGDNSGIGADIRNERIKLNKSKVERKAEKFVKGIILDYCRHGAKRVRTELYRGGTYKIHFETNCNQSLEVHYHALSAKFDRWFID